MRKSRIKLKVMVPERIVIDESVDRVIAEAPNGFFCLKPRHIDFASSLRPGILYVYDNENEMVVAVDEGSLVKCGEEVLVSVTDAIEGEDLEWLEAQVRKKFINREKSEESARIILRNMEANLIRQFVELEKDFEEYI